MHVAIVGGGQLARMTALAGIPLGFRFSFLLDSGANAACVEHLGQIVYRDQDDTPEAVYRRLGEPHVITMESEQLDVSLLEGLAKCTKVYPPVAGFAQCSHRHKERLLLEGLGIPVAPFRYCETLAEVEESDFPCFAKSVSEGYDGKAQGRLNSFADRDVLAAQGDLRGWLIERAVNFDCEVSKVVVRGQDGEIKCYPTVRNTMKKGVLASCYVPLEPLSDKIEQTLTDYAERIAAGMDYVGVLAIEFFLVGDEVIVNEIAPRVHNSGHWTMGSGCVDQFENHLRAITGLSLGTTRPIGASGMVNLLGTKAAPHALLPDNGRLSWYNKAPRPGRKVGHVAFTCATTDELLASMQQFEEALAASDLSD